MKPSPYVLVIGFCAALLFAGLVGSGLVWSQIPEPHWQSCDLAPGVPGEVKVLVFRGGKWDTIGDTLPVPEPPLQSMDNNLFLQGFIDAPIDEIETYYTQESHEIYYPPPKIDLDWSVIPVKEPTK